MMCNAFDWCRVWVIQQIIDASWVTDISLLTPRSALSCGASSNVDGWSLGGIFFLTFLVGCIWFVGCVFSVASPLPSAPCVHAKLEFLSGYPRPQLTVSRQWIATSFSLASMALFSSVARFEPFFFGGQGHGGFTSREYVSYILCLCKQQTRVVGVISTCVGVGQAKLGR